jgi:ribosomal protein S18 acetylase RimI-like enzyme
MAVEEAPSARRGGADTSGRRAGESRRMKLLKRTGLFGDPPSGTRVLRAASVEDLCEAYGLVHEAFVERGYIRALPGRLRVRAFEALPATATFAARIDGKTAAVQSLVFDTAALGLPSDGAFKAEIDALRAKGRVVCEATNEAVAPEYRRTPLATELMRCCFAHAREVGCDDIVTAVSPGHAKFYALLGFEQAGSVRSYSDQIDDPVVLMRVDFGRIRSRAEAADAGRSELEDDGFLKSYYLDDNPYTRYVAAWAVVAERTFADPTLLAELFVHRSRLLQRCSPAELEAIRTVWDRDGRDVFSRVRGREESSAGGATDPRQDTTDDEEAKHMTPEDRAEHLVAGWAEGGEVAADRAPELCRRISEEIAEAVAEEREACAAVVEHQLETRAYHRKGIPGAIREREHHASHPAWRP